MCRLWTAIGVLAFIATPLAAQETQEDEARAYRLALNLGLGQFEGEYGLPEETTFDVVNFNARWYLPRGQIQVSVPYLRLEGPARVQLVGGEPVVVAVDGDTRRKESGIGDSIVQGEYYLRTGSTTSPWVIGKLRLKVPTGNDDKRLGTGATDVEIGIGLIRQFGKLSWLGDVGYNFVGSSARFDLEDVLRLGTGVTRPFGERTSGYLYLENRTKAVERSDDRRSFIVGAERVLDDAQRLRLSFSLLVGLTDATEDLGLYLNLGRRY